MSEKQTSYSIGDPVKVSDQDGEYYGVIVGLGHELTVQMIKQDPQDKVYRITTTEFLVAPSEVAEHKPLYGSDDNAPKAFDELGFRMLDGGSFAKHSDENGSTLMPIGDAGFEVQSDDDDELSDCDSMKDFIVPDDECEPFTHADPSIPFVKETHEAVRAFEGWLPNNEQEKNAKHFIVQQELRAVRLDDEIRFKKGMPAANYTQPLTHSDSLLLPS